MADSQMPYWSWIPCAMAGNPLVPTADSTAPNCLLSGLSNHFNVCFVLNLYVGHTLVGPCHE